MAADELKRTTHKIAFHIFDAPNAGNVVLCSAKLKRVASNADYQILLKFQEGSYIKLTFEWKHNENEVEVGEVIFFQFLIFSMQFRRLLIIFRHFGNQQVESTVSILLLLLFSLCFH